MTTPADPSEHCDWASLQQSEVAALKMQYDKSCRVIFDVGEFTHVVDIRPVHCSVAFKFQLPACYPDVPPEIILRAPKMDTSVLSELQECLCNEAQSLVKSPMLGQLVTSGMAWLSDKNVVDPEVTEVMEEKVNKKKQKKGKEKKKAKEEKKGGKLPSMKTAEDVIKRIMWDEHIATENFSVGYLDRFLGVMEKEFTAFSWEDIASADYSVLAIPKHRIQYFKYKTEKVWDKNERLDNMFGSTGSGKTIADVMEAYEAKVASGEIETTTNPLDDDSDDSDDVEINVGQVKGQPEVQDEAYHWENKMRPNYFVCVRITDPEIRAGVEAMQDAMLEHEERYADCVVQPAALHITLCTLGLDTPELIADACRVLRQSRTELAQMAAERIRVKLEGVDNFYKRVIYGKVHHEKNFLEFVEHMRLLLSEAGLEIRDNYEYVPHMTIMKTTRPTSRAMKTKDVDPGLYEAFTHMYFGTQVLDAIHLCPMNDQRDSDGFYLTPVSIQLIDTDG